jgi:type 2 lantibiotic biosynthesis protein LanM
MPLCDHDVRVMAAAASTIAERVQRCAPADHEPPSALLEAWCQTCTQGDWQQFQQRLARDGLDLDRARHLLALPWPEHTALPAWTTTIQEMVRCIETGPEQHWLFLDAARPLPFEELLAPCVAHAHQRVLAQAGALTDLLASPAHLACQRFLLQVLTSLTLPTLSAELTRVRTQRQRPVPGEENPEQADEGSVYRSMLQQMCQGGLARLLLAHSVLARLLAVTCDLWVETIVELVQRLAADDAALRERFHAGKDPGQVIALWPALSDAHAGRRTVMALTFASGSRLIYKPRSLGMEEAYYHLLRWCNAQGDLPPFHIVTVLDRSTYGWMQYIAQEACQDGEALQRYYERAGMLLCLVYVLGGAECFYDQFIAHHEQPILVDATHLLHPSLSPNPHRLAGEDWEDALYSVLHTGLLASWRHPQASAQSKASEVSAIAISRADDHVPGLAQPPPSVQLKYGSLKPRHMLHIATLVSSAEHPGSAVLAKKFCQGFEQMYWLLLSQRTTLLATGGPLQAFQRQSARAPYRDHAVYDAILPQLLKPEVLHDAVARSLLLDSSGHDCVPLEWFRPGKRDLAHWWPVFAAEREALLQGEIPVMWAPVAQNTLLLPDRQEVASCLHQPAFSLLRERLERLSPEDMSSQLALLQQVFSQQRKLDVARHEGVAEHSGGDSLLALACSLADDIVHNALSIEPAGLTWVSRASVSRRGYSQLRPMRYGFSDGISGVAFFLAALAHRSGIARYRTAASSALRPLTRLLRADGERLACEMGLGAGPGLGSLIYALTHSSRFLDEPALLADAHLAARLITTERIAACHLPDVFLGVAGALLGLITLYETAPTQEVLDRAVACGEHMLRIRTPGSTSARSWQTIGRVQMTGFAHGAAGITYALTRLYALTKERALLEAAQEGMLAENLALDLQVGNWAERVGGKEPASGRSWCHGAPGIGLARLGTLATLNTATVRRDLEIALQTTLQLGCDGLDHLCCGTCGRAELLLTAAVRLARPELITQATRWLEHLSARAMRRGGFLLDPTLPGWIAHPELFQGTAGIAYTLLRQAIPEGLPSILLWESPHHW